MGREVRRVPKDWKHPKNEDGKFIPLFNNCGRFEEADKDWSDGWEKWQEGLCENYSGDEKWSPIEDEYKHMRYSDYAGERPSPDDYMPNWPDEQCTHLMMYEDTSEGTPISPAFEKPEYLAKWLADNGASYFGSSTATYEQWLPICKGGWAMNANDSAVSGSRQERVVSRLLELEQHIRKEADFNRAWTDGRLGADRPKTHEYMAERRRLADERDMWADSCAEAAAIISACAEDMSCNDPGNFARIFGVCG